MAAADRRNRIGCWESGNGSDSGPLLLSRNTGPGSSRWMGTLRFETGADVRQLTMQGPCRDDPCFRHDPSKVGFSKAQSFVKKSLTRPGLRPDSSQFYPNRKDTLSGVVVE